MSVFIRSGFAGQTSHKRTPELTPLSNKVISIFGLGCLGAPSALELARAGIGELRILDPDVVDPATTVRWPRGLSAAGLLKVNVIADCIRAEYPLTKVDVKIARPLGRPEVSAPLENRQSDLDVLNLMLEGSDLVYDATAELGVNHLLSDVARVLELPYLGIAGTHGGWGGKNFRILPNRTSGCWLCYRYACELGTIPEPPSDPQGIVQPAGCAEPTFTGSGFDMLQIALHGVRTAVSTLCSGAEGGYPALNWDVTNIRLRDATGIPIPPAFDTYEIPVDPRCIYCRGKS